ncbi:MAG TPA: ATP-binding protein [Thermoanaerobaculia bacterium]|nr:ATP-binding protein [Thermoanaerobaculia bacterium]
MSSLTRQLQWLIAIRLVVVTSIVLPYFLLDTLTAPELAPGVDLVAAPGPGQEAAVAGVRSSVLYRLAGLTYLASLLYIILLRLRPRDPLIAYVQFFGDLLLITGLVYFTGGITSPFSLFYLVVIAIASTLLRRQAGFTVATLAYLLYASLLLALYFQWITPGGVTAEPGDALFRLLYNLAVNFFAFYAVAVLTSVLAGRATRAERELEAKREDLADLQVLHRDIIQSISSGLATTDPGGRITSLNRAGEEILGASETELLGRPIQELVEPERWERLRSTPAQPGEAHRSEVELSRGDDTVYLGLSVSSLTDASGTHRGYNVVFQDLTRWHRLEQEVRMKDRMAAVGELAAGIAHEIGNPLAAISGSVQMLAATGGGDESQQKLLAILLKESQRLDRTIKGFLRFARPRERAAAEFDVARLLAENFELLRNSDEVGPGHELVLELDPPSVPIVADRDQVSQIFWNLARNALKAMPHGGVLRVSGAPGPGVYRLRVHDTGRGMPAAQRSNLFHPFQTFFDTGTGIGMAIVYRIVQEHGGRIEVDSAEGAGTTILVELPRTASGVAVAFQEAAPEAGAGEPR